MLVKFELAHSRPFSNNADCVQENRVYHIESVMLKLNKNMLQQKIEFYAGEDAVKNRLIIFIFPNRYMKMSKNTQSNIFS